MINSRILKEWDEKIRDGQGQLVAEEMSQVKLSEVLENQYADFINCARRVGLYGPAFSLIKEEYFKFKESGVQDEKFFMEYAAMLSEVGAIHVAQAIFDRFPDTELKESHFYKALHAMKSWNYYEAIDHLNKYLERETEPYWVNIGRLNLMSCYIVTNQLEMAGKEALILEQHKDDFKTMALGIFHEQKAEWLFRLGDFKQARTEVDAACDILKSADGPAPLYCRKWYLLIRAQLEGMDAVESEWGEFIEQCRAEGHWEVIRDLDRFLSVKNKDENLLARVYFGCPFEDFRNLMKFQSRWLPPETYETKPESAWTFDRREAQLYHNNKKFKLPELLRRMLYVLTSDPYRTFAVGYLFDEIYRGEYFHPDFAGQRIYRLLGRFRSLCEENNIPIEVNSFKLGFSLSSDSQINVIYSSQQEEPRWLNGHDHLIDEIADEFDDRPIYAQDVADMYNLSKRTANRVLARGVEEGIFEKRGKSRSTHYKKVG